MDKAIRRVTHWTESPVGDGPRSPCPERGPWRVRFFSLVNPWESPALKAVLTFRTGGEGKPVTSEVQWNLVTGGGGREFSTFAASEAVGDLYRRRHAPLPDDQAALSRALDRAVRLSLENHVAAVARQFGGEFDSDEVRELWVAEDVRRVMDS